MGIKHRRVNVDLDKISQIDWARLAAFIDGEGCVSIRHQKHTKRRKSDGQRYVMHFGTICVTNTDTRLINWLHQTFGGSVQVRHHESKKWRSAWIWVIACQQACEIAVRVRPYMILKADQVDVILALQATMDRVGVRGHQAEVFARRELLKDQIHVLNAKGPRPESIN